MHTTAHNPVHAALCTQFLLKLPRLKTTADFALFTPRGAPCTKAYAELIRDFGSGAEAPYQLLLQPKEAAATAKQPTVASQAFFDDVDGLIYWLANRTASDGTPLIMYSWLVRVDGPSPAPHFCARTSLL